MDYEANQTLVGGLGKVSQTPLESALQELDKAQAALGAEVDDLLNRLNPLLRPAEIASAEGTQTTAQAGNSSSIIYRLQGVAAAAYRTTSAIRIAKDNLEV